MVLIIVVKMYGLHGTKNGMYCDGMEWTISKFTGHENVLRGLHGDSVTWKYVHSIHGEIFQVVVDNGKGITNLLNHETFILSDRNHLGVLILEFCKWTLMSFG